MATDNNTPIAFTSRGRAALTIFGVSIVAALGFGITQVAEGEGCGGSSYAPTFEYEVGFSDAGVEEVPTPAPVDEVDAAAPIEIDVEEAPEAAAPTWPEEGTGEGSEG